MQQPTVHSLFYDSLYSAKTDGLYTVQQPTNYSPSHDGSHDTKTDLTIHDVTNQPILCSPTMVPTMQKLIDYTMRQPTVRSCSQCLHKRLIHFCLSYVIGMVKKKHQRAYKPHPCCLKTLLDYLTVASWCCEKNKVFLQNLVDTFRGNLEELGDGWLRQYFGTSLVSNSRKSKESSLLIWALLADTC
jgi:hypothetical protein